MLRIAGHLGSIEQIENFSLTDLPPSLLHIVYVLSDHIGTAVINFLSTSQLIENARFITEIANSIFLIHTTKDFK